MINFLQSAFAFIVVLGILITFHEFGHFWVARLCNVKILRFSVGFGRPIYRRRFGEDKSEFIIAALPLGGYVKMLDEREGEVAPAERARAFNNKPIGQRVLIVLAGPLFNFIFAVFAYWLMFMAGITGLKPVVGAVDESSIAWQAGIRAGDEIVKVGGQKTVIWSTAISRIVNKVVEQKQVNMTLAVPGGGEKEVRLDLAQVSIDDLADGGLPERIGLHAKKPAGSAVIGKVTAGGAAEQAGLLPGDKIITADGQVIKDGDAWVRLIRGNPGKMLQVGLLRDGEPVTLKLVPARELTKAGETIGLIKAEVMTVYQPDSSFIATESYSTVTALIKGIDMTFEMSVMTLRILGKMVVGEASVKNLSGPITIAKYAGQSAGLGLAAFLSFLAIVSVSLGVLNLLPIPLLDGGHLMYYLIEFVKGSPVSESAQMVGQQLGLVLLLSLMGLAFYNDILRLVG